MIFIDKEEDLMIGLRVPYQWGNAKAPCYGNIIGIRIVTDIMSGKMTGVYTERTFTIEDKANNRIRDGYKFENFERAAQNRLEQIRKILQDSQEGKKTLDISYGELAELEGLGAWIKAGDVELAEAANIPEEEFNRR